MESNDIMGGEPQNVLRLPDGGEVDVMVRRSKRARWILLQVGNLDGAVELVLPEDANIGDGWDFARSRVDWVQRRLRRVLDPIPFVDGAVVPLLGQPIHIRQIDAKRAPTRRHGDELLVAGDPAKLANRVIRWMRDQAAHEIKWRVEEKSVQLGYPVNRVTIRDQKTRWGSCSDDRNLNFSWRLVMTPEPVLDYVVSHEVAHLAEMNHGLQFWAHVETLCPDSKPSRSWLRRHAMELHRYGRVAN